MGKKPVGAKTNMQHLFLAGYRATGKSTVARLLATRLSAVAVDTDVIVQQLAGKNISQIFAEDGEPVFRDWESLALQQAIASDSLVISLGGGTILREENRHIIGTNGRCVWLTASAATIDDRMSKDVATSTSRPSLTGLSPLEEIQRLLDQRQPFYSDVADFIVPTDVVTSAEIAEQIANWWEAAL